MGLRDALGPSTWQRGPGWLLGWGLLLGVIMCHGCTWVGYAAHVVTGDDGTAIVLAEYTGLEHRSVAVLVSTDEYTLFEYPDAPREIGREVNRHLNLQIAGVKLTPASKIDQYMMNHPYWISMPHSQVMGALGVQRLVWIDLVRYATHEPGNRHLWKGVIVANVGVAEDDNQQPDNLVYRTTVEARFPPGGHTGRLGSDDSYVRAGLLEVFAKKVVYQFHDHEVSKP